MNRTFEGLVYEWSQDMKKKNPHKRIGSINLTNIKNLKRKLKKQLLYEAGFDECIEMCIDIIKYCLKLI